MNSHNIQKIEIMCEKHGKQTVNTFVLNGECFVGECPYCKDERAMKQVSAEIARMRIEDALDGIPLRFRNKTLDDYITSGQKDKEAALQACWAIHYNELSNLILIGATEVGKTHLLTATVTEGLRTGKYSRYVTEDDLLKELKEALALYGSDRRVISRYASYDLLAIDEIGRGKQTEYSDTILFSIINKRHEGMRQTMLAGNLTVKELTTYYDDAQLRRLKDGGRVIELKKSFAG
jgi:DNA replication protein DnaC